MATQILPNKNFVFFKPQYDEERGRLFEFLSEFVNSEGFDVYQQLLRDIHARKTTQLNILVEDLQAFFRGDGLDDLILNGIQKNTKRYVQLFSEAADILLDSLAKQPGSSQSMEMQLEGEENMELLLLEQRMRNLDTMPENKDPNNVKDPQHRLPPALKRQYELHIINSPGSKMSLTPLRQLKSDLLGQMVTVKAQVIRVSDVKSQICVAAYLCDACGFEIYQTVNSKVYTPLVECQSNICQTNKTKGKLIANNSDSKFIPLQEIKIQETSDFVPVGNIPRTFNVIATGALVRTCSPGDIVELQGIYLPAQFETFRGLRNKVHDTYIEASTIKRLKKKYAEVEISFENEERIKELYENNDFQTLFTKLAKSIAPEIYGHEDVKKALLLQMIGGVTKQMKDGMKIRGDINIALIGDPGVAKSQLLKYIATVSPRGIYTTGKGSSGVGLTAAVLRDPQTNEITLEGGALVLADMGICCIDEFDKMDEFDRTAIHEVMEQQSVSIAKAGITTTLNARTSILAAANPIFGRYNKQFTPHKNINLPAALLSRFDLVFLLLDAPDPQNDLLLARYICSVHQKSTTPMSKEEYVDIGLLRDYIAKAKTFEPTFNSNLQQFIQEKYVEKRKECNETSQVGYAYTTPRTLLGIIRLAQSVAKLKFHQEVEQEDVDEALRLMEKSQEKIKETMQEAGNTYKKVKADALSIIYQIAQTMLNYSQNKTIKIRDVQKKLVGKGLSQEDLERCVNEYCGLNIWQLSEDKEEILQVQ